MNEYQGKMVPNPLVTREVYRFRDNRKMETYDYYVNLMIMLNTTLRKIARTPDDVGKLKNEKEIYNFVVVFTDMRSIWALLESFSQFDWNDISVAIDEPNFLNYQSWYTYYMHRNSGSKMPIYLKKICERNAT